eukprot:1160804-Pelagomonas_calceolata.AAC.14
MHNQATQALFSATVCAHLSNTDACVNGSELLHERMRASLDLSTCMQPAPPNLEAIADAAKAGHRQINAFGPTDRRRPLCMQIHSQDLDIYSCKMVVPVLQASAGVSSAQGTCAPIMRTTHPWTQCPLSHPVPAVQHARPRCPPHRPSAAPAGLRYHAGWREAQQEPLLAMQMWAPGPRPVVLMMSLLPCLVVLLHPWVAGQAPVARRGGGCSAWRLESSNWARPRPGVVQLTLRRRLWGSIRRKCTLVRALDCADGGHGVVGRRLGGLLA